MLESNQELVYDLMTEMEWEFLLDAINDDRCVLILGPDSAVANGQQKSLTALFKEVLINNLKNDYEVTAESAGQHSIGDLAEAYISVNSRWHLNRLLKKFYAATPKDQGEIQKKIHEMPFSLIISTTFDHLLDKESANLGAYHFNKNKKEPNLGSKGNPLIYNLFGAIDEPDSIVLTANDRLAFLAAVERDSPPFPKKILAQLEDMVFFLFVGFDFNDWYLKLILRILNMSDKSYVYTTENKLNPLIGTNKLYYTNRFKEFKTKSINSLGFFNVLHEKYKSKTIDVPFEKQSATGAKNAKIFVAYDKKDLSFSVDFLIQLATLGGIEVWHELKIEAGECTELEILENFESSVIFIPLLSPDFYSNKSAMGLLEKARRRTEMKVVPVHLRSFVFNAQELYGNVKGYPLFEGKLKPVRNWENHDTAYTSICIEIANILNS